MANSASGESVIERVVKIMDAFSKGQPWLPLKELVRITGMSSSTVHRLAMDLASSGLLERNASGEFGVGMKMWELASRSNPLEEFRRRGLPFLKAFMRPSGSMWRCPYLTWRTTACSTWSVWTGMERS
ncbi:helix-turn-helix domain-containing protein [Arthrobacter sp. TS-15]|uniref:helix-turn-helix domain-containing protein n=1 Tax=Arthrobacter sp. TS-15 TaxID=2510797 RepID=UPI001EE93B4E|nr:helix-turn-helix domain-containing protein [Arthrobacter sp. TS-15]